MITNLFKCKQLNFILALFCIVVFDNSTIAQNISLEENKIKIKNILNDYFHDDNSKTFNAYVSDNNLNIDMDYNDALSFTYPEYKKYNLESRIFNRSKELAYSFFSTISESDLLLELLIDAKFERIYLYFNFTTKDMQYVKYKMYLTVYNLLKISKNFNKQDFYNHLGYHH